MPLLKKSVTPKKKTKDIHKGNGYGFYAGNKIFLMRCFECGSENWAPAVATGQCAWCGFDANKKGKNE